MKTEKLLAPNEIVTGLLAVQEAFRLVHAKGLETAAAIEGANEEAVRGLGGKHAPAFAKDLVLTRNAALLMQQLRVTGLMIDLAAACAVEVSRSLAIRAASAPRPKRRDFMTEEEHAAALAGWKRLRDDVRKTAKAAKAAKESKAK